MDRFILSVLYISCFKTSNKILCETYEFVQAIHQEMIVSPAHIDIKSAADYCEFDTLLHNDRCHFNFD